MHQEVNCDSNIVGRGVCRLWLQFSLRCGFAKKLLFLVWFLVCKNTWFSV